MKKQNQSKDPNSHKLRINMSIKGEPITWINEWKKRGIIRTVPQAVVLALQTLHQHFVEMQLKTAQLRTLEEADSQ